MQTGSVLEYQEAFEELSNKVDGLSKSFLLSCFVFGLKPNIQHEVASFQPNSLSKAMALAKIQEQKFQLKTYHPNYIPHTHLSYLHHHQITFNLPSQVISLKHIPN